MERWLNSQEHLLLSQRTRVQFPSPIWQFRYAHTYISRGHWHPLLTSVDTVIKATNFLSLSHCLSVSFSPSLLPCLPPFLLLPSASFYHLCKLTRVHFFGVLCGRWRNSYQEDEIAFTMPHRLSVTVVLCPRYVWDKTSCTFHLKRISICFVLGHFLNSYF